jgi:hypothetical protein
MCAARPAHLILLYIVMLIVSSHDAYVFFSGIPMSAKCFPQHPVLKHTQSIDTKMF